MGTRKVEGNFTGRKRMEALHEESENKYETLLENLPQKIFLKDSNSVYVSCNRNYARDLKINLNEIAGKTDYDFYPKELADKYRADDKRIMESGGTEEIDEKYIQDGQEVIVHTVKTPVKGKEGNITGILGIFWDITEHKKAKQKLEESKEKYRQLFSTTTDAIMLFDADTREFIEVNKACEDLYGYSREEFFNLKHTDITAEPEESEISIQQKLQGKLHKIPLRYHKKKDRTVFPVEISASSFMLGDRRIICGVVRDITDRKKAEQAVSDSRERYRSLVENIDLGITLIGNDYKIIMTNTKLGTFFNKPASEFNGKYCFREFEKRDAVCSHCPGTQAMATKHPAEVETEGVRDDGSRFPVRIQAFPVFGNDREVIGFIEVIEDIWEKKKTDEKLSLYQNQLRSLVSELSLTEERERRKLAMDLHDQVGQTLAISKIKLGELKELTSSNHLENLVGEISKLIDQAIQETRSLTFELSPPILYELGLEAAAEWLVEQIKNRHGILIDFEGEKNYKPLDGNIRVFLFLVIRELLINVVKHAKARKAKVAIRRDNNAIQVIVQDDGVGLDPSDIGKTGFGLFSIRERLQHLGGRLEVDSEPNKGTRVAIVLPFKKRVK